MASYYSRAQLPLCCRQARRPAPCPLYTKPAPPPPRQSDRQLCARAASTSSPAPRTTVRKPLADSKSPNTDTPLPRGAFTSTPRRPTETRTASPLSLWSTIKSVFGIQPPVAPPRPSKVSVFKNPYRARKKWPPDFTTLHPKHQFHYEKTFRRRTQLKYQRPGWIRGTKVVQYTLTVAVVGYWLFFLQVNDRQDGGEGDRGTMFEGIRDFLSDMMEDEELPAEETDEVSGARSTPTTT